MKNSIQMSILKRDIIIQVLDCWLELYKRNIQLKDFFIKYNYKRIAIYGMGTLGKRLCQELEGSEIEVVYFIDNYVNQENALGCKIYRENEKLPDIDVIVNTVVSDWKQIVNSLSKNVRCEIIPIQDVFYDFGLEAG